MNELSPMQYLFFADNQGICFRLLFSYISYINHPFPVQHGKIETRLTDVTDKTNEHFDSIET